MPNLDLNNAADFARATMQNASLVGGFGGANAVPEAPWDIFESGYVSDQTLGGRAASLQDEAYKLFHVFVSKKPFQAGLAKITDKGGRRVPKYKFPYRDGQTTDDLGRAAEDFSIDCMIHGENYLQGFEELLAELNKPTPGTLRHPVRGLIKVKFVDYDAVHQHSDRKAVSFSLIFTEHNYSLGTISARSQRNTFKDRIAKSTSAFQKITNILDRIQAFDQQARQRLGAARSLLNALNTKLGITLPSLAITFLRDASSITDIPGLLPVNQGGTGITTGGSFPTVASPDDPFVSIPIAQISGTTQAALAAEKAKKEVSARRDEISEIIVELESFDGGDGALQFVDEVLSLRQIAIDLQDTLELGLQTSSPRVVSFIAERSMTLREVAFEFGLNPDRSVDLDVLNPQLESTNLILKGTEVLVPIE